MVQKLLKEEHFSQVFDMGMNFVYTDRQVGASLIFNSIIAVLEDPESDNNTGRFQQDFKASWVDLIIHLYEDDAGLNRSNISRFFYCVLRKALSACQLTETVEHLFETLRSERVNCRYSLQEFGRLIAQHIMCIRKLKPEDFLKITRVYGALNDEEVVSALWESVCSECISIFKSATETRCLFCQMLLTNHSNATEVFCPQATVPMINQALQCSMQAVFETQNSLDCQSIIHYLENIAILKDCHGLSDVEITEKLSEVIARQSSHMLCELLHSLFKSSFGSNLFEKYPTLREAFDVMLHEITEVRDGEELASSESPAEDVTKAFEAIAWCGKQEHVEAMLSKADTVAYNASIGDSYLVSLISSALLSNNDDSRNAAASLRFSRDVFNFLLFELLKVPNHSSHTLSTTFKLFSDAEKSFIDSPPDNVTTEFAARLAYLTFQETVKFVKEVFTAEMNDEGPSLKKFPICWQIFCNMCHQALKKMVADELSKLPVEEIVSLVQSFLWMSDKEGIEELTRLVCALPCRAHLTDVLETIINDKKTEELATRHVHGIIALNDIFDARIQQLNMRLSCQLMPKYVEGLILNRRCYNCQYSPYRNRVQVTYPPPKSDCQGIQRYTKDMEYFISLKGNHRSRTISCVL